MSPGASPAAERMRIRIVRVVGWIYLALGASFLAGLLSPLLWPDADVDPQHRRGEWTLVILPFLTLFPVAFTAAGYRALRYPPLHRRRVLAVACVALTCAWLAVLGMRATH